MLGDDTLLLLLLLPLLLNPPPCVQGGARRTQACGSRAAAQCAALHQHVRLSPLDAENCPRYLAQFLPFLPFGSLLPTLLLVILAGSLKNCQLPSKTVHLRALLGLLFRQSRPQLSFGCSQI